MNNPKADYTHYMFRYYDLRCFPNRESNLYITNIQRFLGCPNESGVYDEELRKTVIDYQKKHGLDADGIIGDKTKYTLLPVCTQ